jgi:hypothetical protein
VTRSARRSPAEVRPPTSALKRPFRPEIAGTRAPAYETAFALGQLASPPRGGGVARLLDRWLPQLDAIALGWSRYQALSRSGSFALKKMPPMPVTRSMNVSHHADRPGSLENGRVQRARSPRPSAWRNRSTNAARDALRCFQCVKKRPGRAAVSFPWSSTTWPFTTTQSMPSG